MPRKRTVQQIAQDAEKKSAGKTASTGGKKGTPAGAKKERAAPARAKKRAAKGRSKRHPTVAQTIERNMRIVHLRNSKRMTFAGIALQLGITEKTAQDGYRMYVEEIAPLLVNSDAMAQAVEFLLKLEGAQEWYGVIASNEQHQIAVRMTAMKTLMECMVAEIKLRQDFGFLPKNLGTIRFEVKSRYIIERVFDLVEKYEMPDEAVEELHDILQSMKDTGQVPEPAGAELN